MRALSAAIIALTAGCFACATQAQLLESVPSDDARPRTYSSNSRAPSDVRALIAPRQYTTLAAEIGARISRLPVPEGGAFRQGDVLIEFDCSIPEAQLRKSEASLFGAERTLEANLRLKEFNSVGKLELDVSLAEVDKNRAEVAQMAATLAKCKVTAPFAGRVAEQKVREQQFVQPGQSLIDILDDNVLEVEFIAPSRWLQWLKPGYRFRVRIDETGKTYPARVQRVGARVDPVSQSIKVIAGIEGQFPELLAGMSGRASFGVPNGN